MLIFLFQDCCLADKIPNWLSNFPESDSTYYTLGIAFSDFGEAYYEQQAEDMAAVIISRLIKTFIIKRFGEIAIEQNNHYTDDHAHYQVSVTGIPEEMLNIKNQLVLIDSFFIDSNFIGLYSYPDDTTFDIYKNEKMELSGMVPEWFGKENSYIKVDPENYMVCGYAESNSLVESYFHAFEDAQYRLAEYKDVTSENLTLDKTSDRLNWYQKFTFLETSIVLEKMKIKHADFSKREEGDKWLYSSYIELEVPR